MSKGGYYQHDGVPDGFPEGRLIGSSWEGCCGLVHRITELEETSGDQLVQLPWPCLVRF